MVMWCWVCWAWLESVDADSDGDADCCWSSQCDHSLTVVTMTESCWVAVSGEWVHF